MAIDPLDIPHTAILAMDCQNSIVARYAQPADEFIARAAGVLRAARNAGMQVIFVQVGFRPGFPEVNPRNKAFERVKASAALFEGSGGAIHPGLGPEEAGLVVTKHRVSAFAGTDLQMILRAKTIDTLVLFGIATSGVVLSTLLEASDLDYRIVVIGDCCVDTDAELHDALIHKMFPKRAEIVSAGDFATMLASPR